MDAGEFRCPVCGAEFVSQQELDEHQRAAHPP
jgi:transcription elongation factor Elf1